MAKVERIFMVFPTRLGGKIFPLMLLLNLLIMVPPGLALDLALIEPSQLQRRLNEWVVLDARPKEEWEAGHIPGALSFSWEKYIQTEDDDKPYRMASAKDLAEELGRMGINEHTPVTVYGDADKSWGGEGWTCWALSWLGHQGPLRLLSGGIETWAEQGRPITLKPVNTRRAPSRYHVNLRPELNVEAAQLVEKSRPLAVIDTRSTLEWLSGHLPSAIHIPWTEFTDKDRRPLTAEALRQLLQDHDVDPEKPVVYYCTGGVRSAYAWLVHLVSGLPTAKNYGGGMTDWKEFSSTKAPRKGV